MKSKIILALCVAACFSSAYAEPYKASETSLIGRLRLIDIDPSTKSSVTGLDADIKANRAIVPELDFTYFWTPNIASELILATSKHDIATDTGIDLGHIWVLPPQITMQYHLNPTGQFRPYLGAGVGYIFYYNADKGDVSSIDYDNGISYTLQAGIDYGLTPQWALNFDIKKIFHTTTATVNGGAIKANVDLDPWVAGTGISYRF